MLIEFDELVEIYEKFIWDGFFEHHIDAREQYMPSQELIVHPIEGDRINKKI